jgi:hypothetical protein
VRGERAEDAAASREGGERGGADAVVVVRVAAAAAEAEEEVVGEDRERAETLEARAGSRGGDRGGDEEAVALGEHALGVRAHRRARRARGAMPRRLTRPNAHVVVGAVARLRVFHETRPVRRTEAPPV